MLSGTEPILPAAPQAAITVDPEYCNLGTKCTWRWILSFIRHDAFAVHWKIEFTYSWSVQTHIGTVYICPLAGFKLTQTRRYLR